MRRALRRPLLTVALLTLVIQVISATWLVRSVVTPNVSDEIAWRLVEDGQYAGGYWTLLIGPDVPADQPELRAFQLPGEALYLAAWFRYAPEWLQQYAHVPVTVLFVTAVAGIASLMGGALVGLVTGLVANVQPFTLLHGPVWDDTFLGAALIWTSLFLVYRSHVRASAAGGPPRRGRRVMALALLALCAGYAALVRVVAQGVLLLIAIGTLVFGRFRAVRVEAAVIVLAVAVAMAGWGYRNYRVTGEFTVSSTHDGVVLLLSNGPYTKRAVGYGQVDRFVTGESMGHHWRNVRGLSELEVDRYYRAEAIRYMVSHPVETLTTAALKTLVTLAGIRPEEPLTSRRNLGALVPNVLLFLLAGWWLALVIRGTVKPDPLALYMLTLVAAGSLAIVAIGPIGWRYRIALDGALWIAAGSVLVHLWARGRGLVGERMERGAPVEGADST